MRRSLSLISTAILLSFSTFSLAATSYKGEDFKADAGTTAVVNPVVPCPAALSLKDGAYVGLQGGYDFYRVRQNIDAIGLSANSTMNPTGFVGGLFAGYGSYANNLYLGGEIFINRSTASSSNSVNAAGGGASFDASTKMTARTNYGISLIPGVKLNDSSLLYLKVGYNRALLTGEQAITSTVGDPTAKKTSNWSNGIHYGVGLETALNPNWSMRGEFTHTKYNSFNAGGVSFAPANNQFTLGLAYHFS